MGQRIILSENEKRNIQRMYGLINEEKKECLEGDCQNGKGKQVWEDGTTYEGDFENGEFWGRGKLTLPDGKVQDGFFHQMRFIGDINSKIKDGILNRGWVLMKGSHKQESKIPGIQDAIRRIQAMLMGYYDTDGIFGPKTEAAVKEYQEYVNKKNNNNNLKVDGKVGKNTLESMSSGFTYPLYDTFFSE